MEKLLLITFFSALVLFGKNTYQPNEIELKKNIAYHTKTHKKVDGVVAEFYETGELMSEKTFKFGVLVDMKTYKISGALASNVIFKNGKAIGGKIYYENPKKDRIMTNADFLRYKLEY
jgi:antitoxin component YwqK of YwqJK toxin-antitoxin module